MKIHLHLALLAFVLALTITLHAQSTTATGDVTPFPDPNPFLGNWDVGGPLIVGNTTTGSLLIENYANVTSVGVKIGNEAGSDGAVTLLGAGWDISSDLYVGLHGTGNLDITGIVNSIDTSVAHHAGSTGHVTLHEYGNWYNTGDLYVGKGGTGTLTVEAGGFVQTKSLYTAMDNLAGAGVIQTKGVVLDFSGPGETLYFNSTHGTNQTLSFGSGGQLQLSMDGTGALGVGYRGEGVMEISEGVKVNASTGTLGLLAGSSGEALVYDSGSEWNVGAGLSVGTEGRGVLTISGGGKVSSSWAGINNSSQNIPSIVYVLSAGSLWTNTYQLNVGETGRAFMQVDYGGRVESGSGILGVSAGGYGEALVRSADSVWAMSGELTIGAGGQGDLHIESGGTVSSGTASIGGAAGGVGTVIVTGVGSHWTNSSAIYVGDKGLGELDIYDGGRVSSAFGAVGETTNSLGIAVVSGANATWSNTYWLAVGVSGTGSLTVADGGKVESTGGLVGNLAGGNGTVVVTGANSTWTNTGNIRIGENGTGTLTVADGGTVITTDKLTVYSAGDSLTLDGGTVTADGGIFILADALIGGNGTINGDLSFASGAKLQFDINGVIAVNGAVSMDNTFGIASLVGLDASVADGSYTVMTSTDTTFGDLNLQNWGYDNRYQLSGQGDSYKAAYFSEGSLVVNVVPEPGTYALLLLGLGVCIFTGARASRPHRLTKRAGCPRSFLQPMKTKLHTLLLGAAILGITVSVSQAAILLQIKTTNSSSVEFYATGDAASWDVFLLQSDNGFTLMDFFTNTPSRSIISASSSTLTAPAYPMTGAYNYAVPGNYTASYSAGPHLTIFQDPRSLQKFSTSSRAFSGTMSIDFSQFASSLPAEGATGEIRPGNGFTQGASFGQYQIIPEPGTYALLLLGLGVCLFTGARASRPHRLTKRAGCPRSLLP